MKFRHSRDLKNRNSSKICLEKLKIFVKVPVKNRNFSEICPEKSIVCLSSCLKKSKFFLNFHRKSKFFDPNPRPPQISNQIDAAAPSISRLFQLAVVIIFVFSMLKYRPAFSLSLLSLLISFARSAFFPVINVVSSAYLKLFSVLPAIFTPSFASSISAFLIILSAYRLNKNGDKMQGIQMTKIKT